ncbi:MAG: LPD1 domain-containing protein [Bacteroidia bacterium]|jgi:hypothetical protein
MKPETEKLVNHYLEFGGERNMKDFGTFYMKIVREKYNVEQNTLDYRMLDYILKKITYGMELCMKHGDIHVIVDEESIEDIKDAIGYNDKLSGKATVKKRKPAKRKKKNDTLGKIVDHGKVAPEGNSDVYWGREGIDLVFLPNDEKVRVGETIPSTYKYADMRYLESYYGLKAFEFGNWLSQQDRVNYLSGLGLALFDLHKLLGFTPKQLGIEGRLSVSFGARGRGKARAHFEPGTFVINLTRYSRPEKLSKRSVAFRRVNLILKGGGVGSFAHEYGHALDFFGGMFIEKTDSFQLSGGNSISPNYSNNKANKNSLCSLMDTLLQKIIWKSKGEHSDYYKRLSKPKPKDYFIQRNEIFARAFEVYVTYRLHKQNHKNVFMSKVKYPERYYLSLTEMKKLEKDFDALITGIKKHL